jgi:hypothetical protein
MRKQRASEKLRDRATICRPAGLGSSYLIISSHIAHDKHVTVMNNAGRLGLDFLGEFFGTTEVVP